VNSPRHWHRIGRAAASLAVAIPAYLLYVLLATGAPAVLAGTYVEDFGSLGYCDPARTVAWWDTVAGEIKLYPIEPSLVGTCQTPGAAYRVVVQGDYAYLATWDHGLTVMSISNPFSPIFVGGYNTPGTARDVAVAGTIACIADGYSGLQVIDISDPSSPDHLGEFDTPDHAYGVAIKWPYVYVADHDSGLFVIDISDPTHPAFAARCSTAPKALDLEISGDHAYIAVKYSGLEIIDISEPTSPVLLGRLDTPGASLGIAVSGDHAYLADWTSGLQVVDVHDPANPGCVGSCDTPSYASDVAVSGGYAYVADCWSGLQVIDIRDPAVPKRLVQHNTPGEALGVAFAESLVHIADFTGGLRIIEVHTDTFDLTRNACHSLDLTPGITVDKVRLTTVQTDSIRWDVSADSGNHWQEVLPGAGWSELTYPGDALAWRSIHFLTQAGINPGCSHLEIECDGVLSGVDSPGPTRSASLRPCLPNPASSTATIRFGVARAGNIRIVIHDITGREIAELACGYHERGEYGEVWDGRTETGETVRPGLYFAYMKAEDCEASEKLILVR